MLEDCTRAVAATSAIVSALLFGPASAHADPPGCPTGATSDESGCGARLSRVSADDVNGTLTGTPVGGSVPITVFGEPDFYLPSTGFGSAAPDLVQQWDATIHRIRDVDPSDPDSYGRGKSTAFLPRALNTLAARLPAGTIMVRFTPDESDPHIFRLTSIQPAG